MRIIGLDLAITSAHKAVVMDERGQFLTPVFPVATWPEELAALLRRAREGTRPDHPLVVIMEPTGLAWLPVATYLLRQPGVTVYLVTSQRVAALRRFYHQHAKSDRVDARVLAKLWLVAAEKLHPLALPAPERLALQRTCKQVDWLTTQTTALHNQITALDRTLWLGGWHDLVFTEPFGAAARWAREHYYDPTAVLAVGTDHLRQQWCESRCDPADAGEWADALVRLAGQVVALYGDPSLCVDFAALQAEVRLKQKWLGELEADAHRLRLKVLRPLYRRLYPARHLETLKGVGQDSAAVYVAFVGDAARFPSGSAFRGWSGLVPRSSQSAASEGKGLHISQAGPGLIKKYAYLNAEVARRYDPQLAKLYYDQMVHKGQHHTQAVCAVATHLLDRVRVVLQEDRPYELRDVDGTPVSAAQARQIIAEKYTVPDEVRQRNNRRARRARAERRAERQLARHEKKEGKPASQVRG